MSTIRGLTLHRPWAWAIAAGHKPVENRTWRPPPSTTWIALHSGLKYDAEAALWMEEEMGVRPPQPEDDAPSVILAVARLDRVTEYDLLREDNDWACGPVCWWLTDVVRLPELVPCRGAQGLWPLPPDVLEEVRRQWSAARGGAR